MKTGDVVQDAQGRSYQVGPLLGRGLWGKSYLVRHGDSEAEFVLKCPLDRDDFRGEVTPTDGLLDTCAEACKEQARILGEASHVFLPPVQSRQSDDGSPLLITPRFTTTLERRVSQGCTLAEVLRILIATMEHLAALAEEGRVHGNLRPSNILLNDRGEVLLTDVTTPSSRKAMGQLQAIRGEPNPYLAPELSGAEQLPGVADTYALAMVLYRASMTKPEAEPPVLPQEGLDKEDLVVLKDQVVARLQAEDSNPRFHARFAENLATTLNRALSKQSSPSPPFRFNQVTELKVRLEDLLSLLRPDITLVGKVILQRQPDSTTFETDEDVRFSVTVGTTAGVEEHEDMACGIAIFDSDTDERIRDVDCHYTVERHPSGRFRFAYKLVNLAPGRFRTRLAFAVRDSGHPPTTGETTFEVRAAAGYVPPVATPKPSALPFAPVGEGDTSPTQPAINQEDIEPQPIAPGERPIPSGSLDEPLNLDQDFGAGADPTLNYMLDSESEASPQLAAPQTSEPGPAITPDPSSEPEVTEPAVTLDTQVPAADPLKDIVGGKSWTSVPLPGRADPELPAPDLDDAPDPNAAGPLQRIIDMVFADIYLMFMGAAGLVILALIIILAILKN